MNSAMGYFGYRLIQFLFGERAWIVFVGLFVINLLLFLEKHLKGDSKPERERTMKPSQSDEKGWFY